MITGDNPLTAVHVAREVEIVDREALILDLAENAQNEQGRLFLIRLRDSIQLITSTWKNLFGVQSTNTK